LLNDTGKSLQQHVQTMSEEASMWTTATLLGV